MKKDFWNKFEWFILDWSWQTVSHPLFITPVPCLVSKIFSFFAHFAMPPPLDPLSTVRNGRVQFFSVFLYFMLFCNKKRMTQSFFIQLPSVSPDSILIGPLIRILMRHPPKASRSDTCTHTPTDTYTLTHNQNLIQPNTHTHTKHSQRQYTQEVHTHTHTKTHTAIFRGLQHSSGS